MKPQPTLEQWQELIDKLPSKLILRHPSLPCQDILKAMREHPELNIVWHTYDPEFTLKPTRDDTTKYVDAMLRDLERGKVVVVNSLIDFISMFRHRDVPFVLAFSTHRAITERARNDEKIDDIVEKLWRLAVDEYTTIRDLFVYKVAGNVGDSFYDAVSKAHLGPK